MRKKVIRKSPMIMLELILAVAIIGISSSLIIGVPSKVYQKELALLYELELEREAENFFANLLINFKDKHTFDSLTKEKKSYYLDTLHLQLESYAKTSFDISYKLWARSTKESNNNTFYKLIGCKYCIGDSSASIKLKKKPIFFTLLTRLSPKREALS